MHEHGSSLKTKQTDHNSKIQPFSTNNGKSSKSNVAFVDHEKSCSHEKYLALSHLGAYLVEQNGSSRLYETNSFWGHYLCSSPWKSEIVTLRSYIIEVTLHHNHLALVPLLGIGTSVCSNRVRIYFLFSAVI